MTLRWPANFQGLLEPVILPDIPGWHTRYFRVPVFVHDMALDQFAAFSRLAEAQACILLPASDGTWPAYRWLGRSELEPMDGGWWRVFIEFSNFQQGHSTLEKEEDLK